MVCVWQIFRTFSHFQDIQFLKKTTKHIPQHGLRCNDISVCTNVITVYYAAFNHCKTYPQYGWRVGHYQSEFVVYLTDNIMYTMMGTCRWWFTDYNVYFDLRDIHCQLCCILHFLQLYFILQINTEFTYD